MDRFVFRPPPPKEADFSMFSEFKCNLVNGGEDTGRLLAEVSKVKLEDSSESGLTDDQSLVFRAVKAGKSVLMTGGGGCGKSYLIEHIVNWARGRGRAVNISSTTGSSAVLINGTTLHSFLGIGIGTDLDIPRVVRSMNANRKRQMKSAQLLIIDEVGMLDSSLFETASRVLQVARNNYKPFGGCQVVLSGDLYQIPPISGDFFFKSDEFKKMNAQVFELTTPVRQSDDLLFAGILIRARTNKITDEDLDILNTRYIRPQPLQSSRKVVNAAQDNDTHLFVTNCDVDRKNVQCMAAMLEEDGMETIEFETLATNARAKSWAKSCKIPEKVELCKGCRVVVSWNIDLTRGICNGAQGIVTEVTKTCVKIKMIRGGKEEIITSKTIVHPDDEQAMRIKSTSSIADVSSVTFMPLRLAYALTINKCQGMTLDKIVANLSSLVRYGDDFVYGRAYTALSRVRSLEDITITGGMVTREIFRTHPDVIEFFEMGGSE